VNTTLRQIVKQKMPAAAAKVFQECSAEPSPIFYDLLKGEGPRGGMMMIMMIMIMMTIMIMIMIMMARGRDLG
jgi:hypothetical protein